MDVGIVLLLIGVLTFLELRWYGCVAGMFAGLITYGIMMFIL